jgi:hypothetical protein
MRTTGLGSLLARLAALALPLAGCCETTSHAVVVDADGRPPAEGGGADAGVVGAGALDCQRLCLPPIIGRCSDWVVDTCERADAEGRTVTCHYVETQCPDVLPIPRATCGRRTDGVGLAGVTGTDALGRALAHLAALEAASIPAFARLARELAHHGAPGPLRRAAERARRDEVRHAATMRGLARGHGGLLARVAGRAGKAARPLAEVAIENAVEGCVRETWGAAVAAFQARSAGVPAVRAAMAAIARDEARHAALAWRVHAWALGALDEGARRRCERALRDEAAALHRELADTTGSDTARALGLPTGAAARSLAAGVDRALWSAA